MARTGSNFNGLEQPKMVASLSSKTVLEIVHFGTQFRLDHGDLYEVDFNLVFTNTFHQLIISWERKGWALFVTKLALRVTPLLEMLKNHSKTSLI